MRTRGCGPKWKRKSERRDVAGHAMPSRSAGAARHRNLFVTVAFALLVTMVIFTILDLDRPRRGVIQVDQAPMLDLQAGLRR